MIARKFVTLALVVALFTAGLVRPAPARASNLPIIIGAAVGGYLVFIGIATYLIYNHREPMSSTSFLPPSTTASREPASHGRLRVGTECAPTGSSTVWVCW